MKNRLLAILLCLCMTMTLLPTVSLSAAAEGMTEVSYIDVDGTTKSVSATCITGEMTLWGPGWYYASGSVSVAETVTTCGNVNLILEDGCSLEITGGLDNSGILVDSSARLTIYGQNEGSGTLTARGNTNGAGIGGDGDYGVGCITINGGTVYAYGAGVGAGIGTAAEYKTVFNITINGGTVYAYGQESGAGIGSGYRGSCDKIIINGGMVYAYGQKEGAGIGSGKSGGVSNITINGGTVYAENTNIAGAGIGGGNNASANAISITGGTITASSNVFGAGIGGGYYSECRSVNISGGTITATGGQNGGAGIGGGYNGDCASISITGGTINAAGREGGAGIGGARSSSKGGAIYISGGNVKAQGSAEAQDIGDGAAASASYTLQNNSSDQDPVFLTAVTLDGLSGAEALTSLTTEPGDLYRIHDMNTDDSGGMNLYLPTGIKVIGASAADVDYGGQVIASNEAVTGTLYEVPEVTSVAAPESNSYRAGDALTFTVRFSTGVTVDSSAGTPYIPLTVGAAAVHALYQSGSGTADLVFSYTVADGDRDTDGIAIGHSIELNGGTIKNSDAAAVSTLNSIPDLSGVLVDAVVPTVICAVPGSGITPVGGNAVITFSEAMAPSVGTVSITPVGGSVAVLNDGTWSADGTVYTTTYSGLAFDTVYQLSVTGFCDATGNLMTVYTGSFTTEEEPQTPSVTPTCLTLNKGGTATFFVFLGQGAAAATTAELTVGNAAIVEIAMVGDPANGTVSVSGLTAGETNITVTFNDIAETEVTVAVTVNAVAPVWGEGSSLTASNVSPTGTVLTWTAASDITEVTAYRIYQDGVLVVTLDGAARTHSVTGLSSSTDYHFQVQAGNADGIWTTDGPVLHLRTLAVHQKEDDLTALVTGDDGSSSAVSVRSSGGRVTAVMYAAQGNTLADGAALVLTMPTVKNATSYGVQLGADQLSGNAGGTLTMHTDFGSIAIPSNMLSSQPDVSNKIAKITIEQGDRADLPDDVRAAIGDRPLVRLALSIDGSHTAWNNPDAALTVRIPYTPTEEERIHPESIVIWYIDGAGNAVPVPNGCYDSETQTVTFATTHFSQYAVGYHPVGFGDVAETMWCYRAVSFIAARGITGGTSHTTFSPNATLTRGQFITLLLRAYDIAPDDNPSDNFSDAGSTYYTGYLAAAKRLGIANGVGDQRFAPEQAITREQMFTLIYNTLKQMHQLPEGDSGKTCADFADGCSISVYAREAMAYFVKTGVVGGSNGALLPKDTTTRAQMAQVLYRLLSK